MKIILDNIGLIKHAEIEPGDITILCGQNNTGKTYATYAYYGFLSYLMSGNSAEEIINLQDVDFSTLYSNKLIEIPLTPYLKDYENILRNICVHYTENLPAVFAADKTRFKNAKFQILVNAEEIGEISEMKLTYGDFLILTTDIKKKTLLVTNMDESGKKRLPPFIITAIIAKSIIDVIFENVFPGSYFIASVERTGASIFKQELFLNRNRIYEHLNEIAAKNKDVDFRDILVNSYSPYPYPVKDNVSYVQDLSVHQKHDSKLSKVHPEILTCLSQIIGGTYTLDKDDNPLFTPNNAKTKKLHLTESSSVVRALIHLDYYLRYDAKKGDVLIVDEPELNLHPENQRLIARIFARLVNAGIKVFITTHSDYIIRELNTLILLGRSTPECDIIREEYGYEVDEVLDSAKVHVYNAQLKIEKKTSRSKSYSNIIETPVSKELGIEIESFDNVIKSMNEIQDKLLWCE